MAGVKGKSGGRRAGAGRKPRKPELIDSKAMATDDPVAFLTAVMKDGKVDLRERKDAAKALLAYQAKIATGGKKEQRQDAAKRVSDGKFAPSAPPKLALVK